MRHYGDIFASLQNLGWAGKWLALSRKKGGVIESQGGALALRFISINSFCGGIRPFYASIETSSVSSVLASGLGRGFVLRQTGKAEQLIKAPRRPIRSAMGAPHFSQG